MKILICSSFFEKRTNGTALFPNFALEINALYPQHEVRIVTPDVAQSYDKVFKVEFKYPRPLHAFYTLLSNFSYYNALKKIQREYDFEIVLFNHAASGVWSRWFLNKKIKVLGFIHDDDSLKPKRENHLKYRHYLIHQIKRRLELTALKNFDGIFCPSNFIRDLVLSKTEIVKNKAHILYQSIDIKSIIYNNKLKFEKKIIKILFVKFSYVRGGLLDLIDAIGLLHPYHFQLTTVGSDIEAKDVIENKAKPCSNIVLNIKQYCTPEEVSQLMYENDIICVPARAEVLGLVNVEGLAHGTAVVSTDVGGIPEVMDNGKNGWLAEPNNPSSLANALKDCIEATPSVLKAKSDAGRKYVEENFDFRTMIARFVEICEKTIHAS